MRLSGVNELNSVASFSFFQGILLEVVDVEHGPGGLIEAKTLLIGLTRIKVKVEVDDAKLRLRLRRRTCRV